MAWLLVVFQLLVSLPNMIKIILEILRLIRQQPTASGREMYRARLRDICDSLGSEGKFTAQSGQALDDLLTDLRTASRKVAP